MNYRRLSQAAEWAVVAAVVALHVLIGVLAPRHPDVAWLQVAGDAQPLAAIALLAAWAWLGPGRLWIRACAVPILALAWAVTVSSGDRRYFNPADSELPFPFAIAIVATLTFGCIRLAGLRTHGIAEGQPEPRPQFSIFALLAATTLVAAVIGGLEFLRPTIVVARADASYDEVVRRILSIEADATFGRLEVARGLIPAPATLRELVLSLAIVGCAVGGLATVLRPGRIWLRLAIVALALPMLGVYLTHLAGTGRDEFIARSIDLTTSFAAVALLVGLSVLPLRLFGFRMLRKWQHGSSAAVKCALPASLNSRSRAEQGAHSALAQEVVA